MELNGKKIGFFVGAGAEGNSYNLPLGDTFFINTLLQNLSKEKEFNILKKYNNEWQGYNIYDDGRKKHMLKRVVKNYLQENENDNINNIDKSYIVNILSKSDAETILNKNDSNYNDLLDKNKEKKCFETWEDIVNYIISNDSSNYEHIVNSEIYKKIFCKFIDDDKETKKLSFSKYVTLPFLLDEKFHTIIDREKYGKVNFFKVFNYYWHCYFYMVENILKYNYCNQLNEKLFKYYTEDEGLNYEEILLDICGFTEELYKLKDIDNNTDCYYYWISTEFSKSDLSIITTNYFNFVEKYIDNPVYLNGELKNFEFCDLLEVHEANESNKSYFEKKVLFFPFIFGQSYVKPIIHQKQIDQYSRFKNILDEIDILVVLGYNINPDDNHINAYLHNYALNKPLLIVSDNNNIDEFKAKLRLDEQKKETIFLLNVNYKNDNNEKIVKKIKEEVSSILKTY